MRYPYHLTQQPNPPGAMMHLITLLTQLAENCHHQVSVEKLLSEQPLSVREAFAKSSNTQLKKIMAGSEINFADRDDVAFIDKADVVSH
jgi:hypothetical protein